MHNADLEELCDATYERLVKAAFLIVGDRQEALDIAQETFARAIERWSQVRMMENPEGWLYRVAVNLSLSARRRASRRVRGYVPSGVESPDEPADPELARALRRLTPAQRSAVVLRFYVDLSVDATAGVLGKRPGTIRALTSQAMDRLRADLGTQWLEDVDERTVP